jgi:TorA maturation chaperone TorD
MNARNRLASAPELLADAAQWRLISLLLLRPTTERKQEVRQLADEVGEQAMAAAAHDWCEHATEGAYLHLLGPGGLVPAREVAYRPFADPGWLLADVNRYHQAFGYHADPEEPPDHLAALADFVAYLFVKEAYARHCDDDERAKATRAARERFVEEHVSPIAVRLAERLDGCGATEWSAAAHLLATKVPPPPGESTRVQDEEVMQCRGCVADIEL